MHRLTRRDTLRTGGVAVGVLLAGCPGDGSKPTVTDVTVWQLGGALGEPPWYEHDAGPAGVLALFDSPERVEAFLTRRDASEERSDTLRSVAGDTDFSTSALLFVESAGPDTCHGEVGVEGVGVADGRIVGTATARDSADGQVCGPAITFPAALLRVTLEGGVPGAARFTVVDGWGNEEAIDATLPGG